MDKKEVLKQSQRAYDQWSPIWRHNSNIAKGIPKIPMSALKNQGIGKELVIISMGGSFEKQVEYLKKYQDKVDILAVDKAFAPLMERGIRPDFVLIADARVSFSCYCEPFLKDTKDIVLLSNVNANPDWGANWKGIKSYYVNKDNIQSEIEFSRISGVEDQIHAGSNVSNAALIYANSVLNYDKYILLGFDFSWEIGGKFYSFAHGTEKMGNKSVGLASQKVLDRNYDMVNTSENLWFSSRWLDMYIQSEVGGKALNASDGILEVPKIINLNSHLSAIKQYKRGLTDKETDLLARRTLTIKDKDSYDQAHNIITSKDAIMLGGQIEYRMPIDMEVQKAIDSKYPEKVV